MFSKETYVIRRKILKEKIQNGLILLPGNQALPFNYASNTFPFRQDSTFIYYIGVDQPYLFAIIDVDSGEEYLFGSNATPDDIIWTGLTPTVEQLAQSSGITHSGAPSDIATIISQAVKQKRKIHYINPYQPQISLILANLLGINVNQLAQNQSLALIHAVAEMRKIKEPQEIAEIDRAARTTAIMEQFIIDTATDPACRESEKSIRAGLYRIFMKEGFFYSFPPIVTTHGEIFHQPEASKERLKPGSILLADIGAESDSHYAGDMTRSIPVGGKFTPQQKDVYDIVLNAQKTVFNTAHPGETWLNVHLTAARVITEGLKNLGLLTGSTDDIIKEGAYALFFPHGIGHLLGLDVHDMENLGEDNFGYNQNTPRSTQFGLCNLRYALELKENMTLTNEPGIYFIPYLMEKWKAEKRFAEFINYDKALTYSNFGGIRIEDDIVITQSGCRILGMEVKKEF